MPGSSFKFAFMLPCAAGNLVGATQIFTVHCMCQLLSDCSANLAVRLPDGLACMRLSDRAAGAPQRQLQQQAAGGAWWQELAANGTATQAGGAGSWWAAIMSQLLGGGVTTQSPTAPPGAQQEQLLVSKVVPIGADGSLTPAVRFPPQTCMPLSLMWVGIRPDMKEPSDARGADLHVRTRAVWTLCCGAASPRACTCGCCACGC